MFKEDELKLLLIAVNEQLLCWGDLPNMDFTKLKRKLKYQLKRIELKKG